MFYFIKPTVAIFKYNSRWMLLGAIMPGESIKNISELLKDGFDAKKPLRIGPVTFWS
jgi:hypothetical protein